MISAWLAAFAAPGQVMAAIFEDPPLFASETQPAVGPSIRQAAVEHRFRLLHKWLGAQWSIGDEAGLQKALSTATPAWILSAMEAAVAAGSVPPQRGEVMLREYDPDWAEAFYTGRVGTTCDHENMLRQVKVPVLFTHHFRVTDPTTGNLLGASSDQQVSYVRELIESTGNPLTYRSFPSMPHSMHGADPVTVAQTIGEWIEAL